MTLPVQPSLRWEMLTNSLELRARWRAACDEIVRRSALGPTTPAPVPSPTSDANTPVDIPTPSA